MRSARDRDRGSATVLVLAIVAVGGALILTTALLIGAQAARAAAQTAADFAALAAGEMVQLGHPEPCAVASEAARRNDAHMETCRIASDGVVDVEVTRAARGLAGGISGTAHAHARAGPDWSRNP